jgi:catalase-peroxidase
MVMQKKALPGVFAICTIAAAGCLSTYASADPLASKPAQFWWPDQLDLTPLRQHDAKSNPLGEEFNYARPLPVSTSRLSKRTSRKF